MIVSIIGTGNVAHVLAHHLHRSGHTIAEITGRNPEHVAALADKFGATASAERTGLQPAVAADLYIIALSDNVLYQLPAFDLGESGLWVHTAGSVGMQVLQNKARHTGVLYPLQSLVKIKMDYTDIPFLVNSAEPGQVNTLVELVNSMGFSCLQANDNERLQYHLAAVFANNFGNYMFTAAADICAQAHLPFGLLHPLIMETATRSGIAYPGEFMTGPAVRGDSATMEKHLGLLEHHEEFAALYAFISKAIGQHEAIHHPK